MLKKKYVVPVLIVLFLAWLIYSMSGSTDKGSSVIDQYIEEARAITMKSDGIKFKQQDLIENIRAEKIDADEAREKCREYLKDQQNLLSELKALDTPEKISGPVTTLRVSLQERVDAAQKTLQYLEKSDVQLFNKIKEHLIRSSGGVNSAYRRMEDYK